VPSVAALPDAGGTHDLSQRASGVAIKTRSRSRRSMEVHT
jgi:hypothetical protein